MKPIYVPVQCSSCRNAYSLVLTAPPGVTGAAARDEHARDVRNWHRTACPSCKTGALKLVAGRSAALAQAKGTELLPPKEVPTRKRGRERDDAFVDGSELDAMVLDGQQLDDLDRDDRDLDFTKPAAFNYKGSVSRLNADFAYPWPNITAAPVLTGLKEHIYPKQRIDQDNGGRAVTGAKMKTHYRGPRKTYYAASKHGLPADSVGNQYAPLAGGSRGKRKRTRHHEYEWCHAVADCLGGATEPNNLFAGSFDANTFMAVLEERLRVSPYRTDMAVEVRTYYEARGTPNRTSCRRAPKWIRYEVSMVNPTKAGTPFVVWIDAQCFGFNRRDWHGVHDRLNRWLDRMTRIA